MMSPQYGLSAIVAIALIAGVSDASWPKKIVNGVMAEVGEFTYMASVRENGKHICGGSFVDQRHVVTADHCVSNFLFPCDDVVIATGNTHLNAKHVHLIESIKRHENRDNSEPGSPYDIAIIVLKKNIIFNDKQTSVALPDGPTPNGLTATMIGWAMTIPAKKRVSPHLRKINTTILSSEECFKSLEDEDKHNIDEDSHICAVNPLGIGIRMGDSGNPLIYDGRLVGIASAIFNCDRKYPDIYTNVSYFVSWIREKIAETYKLESQSNPFDIFSTHLHNILKTDLALRNTSLFEEINP